MVCSGENSSADIFLISVDNFVARVLKEITIIESIYNDKEKKRNFGMVKQKEL